MSDGSRLARRWWAFVGASVVLAMVVNGAFNTWVPPASPRHDLIEGFLAIWLVCSSAATLLLALAGLAIDAVWRPLVILALLPVGVLVELVARNLVGALADGAVSEIGWIAGGAQVAQAGVLMGWLFLIGWWRERWVSAVVSLIPGAITVALLLAWQAALQHWVYWGLGTPFLDDQLVGFVPYWWTPVSVAGIVFLAFALGDAGRIRAVLLVLAALAAIGLWVMVAAEVVGALRDGQINAVGAPLGIVSLAQGIVMTAWVAVVFRWARMSR